MDLYILRHGKAEQIAQTGNDADRKLTKKGREDILAAGTWMAAQGIRFDLIATSPLVRAQETAAIVAGVLEFPAKPVIWDCLVPEGTPDTLCREISRFENTAAILLTGHEPLLSAFIGRIIAGDEHAGIVMTKGGLAKIRNFYYSQHPVGELHWLLTARQLAACGP